MAAKKRAKKKSAKTKDPLPRLLAIVHALPETTTEMHGVHTKLVVKKKTFGWYTINHHGDGRLALWVKTPPGVQQTLLDSDPVNFFFPPYVGKAGWIGARLDVRPDWEAIALLVEDSYRLTAPKKLIAALDALKAG